MDLVPSSRGESLPVGQASEIQLRIQVGSLYPQHHSAHSVRFDEEVRSTAGRRPYETRDVEHSAGDTASRLPLFAHPYPTALQLHAATAHTDVERLLLSARCWHGFAMTGANGKLFAAADIKRSDLVLDRLCCSRWLESGLVTTAATGPRSAARQLSARPLHRPEAWQRRADRPHGKPTSCDEPTRTHTHLHARTRTHTHTHTHTRTRALPRRPPMARQQSRDACSCPCYSAPSRFMKFGIHRPTRAHRPFKLAGIE